MLNHASYGLASSTVLAAACRIRHELETDPLVHLGRELVARERAITAAVAARLGLDAGGTALTQNATSGAAAIMRSLRIPPGARIVVLSTEYSSIRRGWEVRSTEAGAHVQLVTVPMPLRSVDDLLEKLDNEVKSGLWLLQLSLVSSSEAIALPVKEIGDWCQARGARLILDAAHGPGHVPLTPSEWGVSAMFGTMHKWLPTPRPVGFLWLSNGLRDEVRPAEVSLTWDAPELVERFSWPGTHDPTPRLCLETAMDQWDTWQAAGEFDDCNSLADQATIELGKIGAIPTAGEGLRPARLRAFLLPDIQEEKLRAALAERRVRAWTGSNDDGIAILRLAIHIYNDLTDILLIRDIVAQLMNRPVQ